MPDPPIPAAPEATTFLFLVDRAFVADRQRNPTYDWPKLPTTALTRIAETLPLLHLRPQDAFEIAWISGSSFDSSELIFGRTNGPDDPPFALPPRPPLPALVGQYCNTTVQEERNRLAKQWRTEAQKAVDDFTRNVEARQSEYVGKWTRAVFQIAPVPDPRGTDIDGALVRAMAVHSIAPDQRIEVVLFTDLNATVTHGAPIDLRGIRITIGLFYRADPADYLRAKQEWSTRLVSLRASSVTFLSWDDTSAMQLARAVGR